MAVSDTIQSIKTHLTNAYNTLETKGATILTNKNIQNLSDTIDSIPSGGGSEFTGHYDAEGLTQIGWTSEEIQYYQDNGVQWNEENDDAFELTETELVGDNSANTRFLPKSATNTSFANYYRLLAIPLINLGRITSNRRMFANCYSLITIPLINTNKVTVLDSMFTNCYSLKTIPQIDTSNVTVFYGLFQYCYSLKTVPQIDTSKGENFGVLFNGCRSLTKVPELDFSKCIRIDGMLIYCYSLVYLGGFKNIGQAYLTSQSASYNNYKLDLSYCTLLTHDSLMNVINDLYDIGSAGVKPQQLVLGSTNLNKLTAEEKAIATSKGWLLS